MPRAASPFYHSQDGNLGAAIGSSLARALFGDPDKAAELALRKAQMDNYGASARESDAHAGLYGEQTRGAKTQNDASLGLPDLFAKMFVHQAAPVAPAGPVDPLAALPPPPEAVPPGAGGDVAFDPQTFRNGLPALLAAMGQAQGDKINPNDMIGGLTALFGNDEFARRGLIGMGHTPDKDFALTPERADDISARDATEALRQALSVANIGAETQRRGQDIGAATARRGQDISSSTQRRGQDISSGDRRAGLDAKFVPMGERMISDVFPGAVPTSGERSVKHNREVDGAEGSYHLPGDGVETYDMPPQAGMSFAEAKAKMRAKYGSRLVEALDETNRPGHGPHWHFAVAQERAPTARGGKAVAPKAVNAASMKLLDTELDKQLKDRGINPTSAKVKSEIRAGVTRRFQQSGSPVVAVNQTLDILERNVRNNEARKSAGGGAPPVQGARKAPDGKWYVKRGGQWFRVDAS